MKPPYPSKISPTPIVSAAIEIRFDISCPIDAVYGLVQHALKQKFHMSEKLPVAHIPEDIRVQDNLIDQPHYRLFNNSTPYSILVGPRVFVFVYSKENFDDTNDYPGWSEFIKQELVELYKTIFALDFIVQVKRLGIRYGDFFAVPNIFDHTEFNLLNKDGKRKDTAKTQIVQTIKKDDTFNNIVVSNNSTFVMNGRAIQGSMIDIDTFMGELDDFMSNYEVYLQKCHEINKELFFEMLQKEFIDTFNPIYGDEDAN
ncbi:TIGR04255 family protein [Sulfurimonas sp. CVO]|uniref:TIGR04255 family protein n=1 Tax=Sulfurimonas sp. CVO TaxID=2283483 RepID=UPI00132F2D26|nr:TIGR04255 family protein [Sulfurimonas sp. CVO]QHG91863.1 TIGR04255 family protein [Sulfurimonas sp. CVO]